MEIITGHIKEKKELISGEIKEYCTQSPVLVKDSAGTLLYTKNPGEIATITDSLIKDSSGTTKHSVKAQAIQVIPDSKLYDSSGTEIYSVKSEASQIIPDVIAQNSEGTTIATIKAKSAPTTVADITVTNPITGATYTKPAAKNFTESAYKKIKLVYKAGYDDTQDYDITAEEAGTYTGATLVNCTAVYKINDVISSLPLTFVNTNKYTATITRTNAALDASVTITT